MRDDDLGTTPFSSVYERFMDKVIKSPDGCWEWTAATRDGYGLFRVEGKLVSAHRWRWEWDNGPVPEGLELDHLCRNRRCVRPDHIEAVTHKENVRRGDSGWKEAEKKTCPKGHPYDTIDSQGKRRCSICVGARYQKKTKVSEFDKIAKKAGYYE